MPYSSKPGKKRQVWLPKRKCICSPRRSFYPSDTSKCHNVRELPGFQHEVGSSLMVALRRNVHWCYGQHSVWLRQSKFFSAHQLSATGKPTVSCTSWLIKEKLCAQTNSFGFAFPCRQNSASNPNLDPHWSGSYVHRVSSKVK